MRFLLSMFFLLSTMSLSANNRLDSLLKVLDRTVEDRFDYVETKEDMMNKLKHQLSFATVEEQRFKLTENLFYLYSNYQTDSAFHYAEEKLHLAHKINKPEMIATASMNMAEVFRTTGMYKESLELLDDIGAKGLSKYDEGYYRHLYHSLYMLMSEYSISKEDKKKYNSLVFNYKDSILQITSKEDISYYLVSSTKYIMEGEYNKALELMQKAYDLKLSSAMVCYTLSDIYKHLGDREKEKIYLAESAIADLKAGVKEYISLQELATLLFEEGDIDRAYLYMKTSMEDAIFCNARLRTLEISRMLPMINATYDIKTKQEQKRVFTLFAVTIVLALVLAVALILIYQQVNKLKAIRKYQKQMNNDLKKINEELNSANSELTDANLIKEEYIGYLFKICSSYIDKLEDFRLLVNRKLKTGQVNELNKLTSSSSLVADELKEFYRNFDTVFLNIYPTFVEELNSLLLENEKIEPKEGDLLTPELRIYALIRLGIHDSVKIADFLHYSPQTIYNYRLKIRNKLAVSREDFSVILSKIGMKKHS